MSDRFEIMKHWVPFELVVGGLFSKPTLPELDTVIPLEDKSTESAWDFALEIAREGWELVGTVPVIASIYPSKYSDDKRDISSSYTTGYFLFFKRRIE